ncbi:coatomer subunit delta-2 isoform X2 [Dendrobium catenatum]|uniref:Coatomer subunit delta n=1 Tax=Dendrobium catenatum TaxID=906689 RepID=A0A2I0XJI0_9ASPA|nr:coatomer subunit delta-2 isoform X2 [Dendrobium catenatum]XP_028551455.1 coatomer subunit delta-2 isoform X2 [Dendrobium catenatum]PKU88072.1 Coatomer subunit delta-2 [Dendrobium catenatum]
MVVLAASIISKSGTALVSRQFVDMSRIRIEGLLAAFPKLVGSGGKQHTFVETENVRYVYQPIEALYLLLITNKQSNIVEDLGALTLLAKLIPEYSPSLDEEGVCKAAFELLFAFDETISLGYKENVTVAQVKQYCEMESHEERLHKLVMQSKINETKDVMKRKASEIDKNKLDKSKGDKGGFMSLSGSKNFSDLTLSSSGAGFGSGSGLEVSTVDSDSYSSKFKGRHAAPTTATSKGLGMQLGKTQRASQLMQSLQAEGEVILDDVPPTVGQAKSSLPPTDPITLIIEEKLNIITKRDGGVTNFDVQGTLSLQIRNQEDGLIQFQIENQDIPGLNFKTHPNINKELFNNRHIIGLKDPNRPFPTGQNDVGLMKWRIQGMNESSLPLTVNCWPSVSGRETSVNIEYEATERFDLQNVVISVPLPAVREPPNVLQIDGEWRYDARSSALEWSILLIDNTNRSGSMEFVVPSADPSAFFPITIGFTAAKTFSDVKVVNVIPLRGGATPKYAQRIQLVTDIYQVV